MATAIPGTFDAAALRWAATRQRDRRVAAMAAMRGPGSGDLQAASAGLRALFGLDRTHHFLRSQPSDLHRLLERQLTEGLAKAVGSGSEALVAQQALFDAIGDADSRLARALPPAAEISAGPRDRKRRIDLLLRGYGADGVPRCLVIEAKFGHDLAAHQLSAYRRGALHYLREMHGGVDAAETNATLVIVEPRLTSRTAELLAIDNRAGKFPRWRSLSWRRLLLGAEAALPDTPDAARFRRHLRQLWDSCDAC